MKKRILLPCLFICFSSSFTVCEFVPKELQIESLKREALIHQRQVLEKEIEKADPSKSDYYVPLSLIAGIVAGTGTAVLAKENGAGMVLTCVSVGFAFVLPVLFGSMPLSAKVAHHEKLIDQYNAVNDQLQKDFDKEKGILIR